MTTRRFLNNTCLTMPTHSSEMTSFFNTTTLQFTPHARSTRQWLRDNNVTVLDWPPNSPDANPIENLWRDVKTAANSHNPRTQEELWEAVSEAWQTIPPARVQNLAASVARRVAAIRRARGGHTKY